MARKPRVSQATGSPAAPMSAGTTTPSASHLFLRGCPHCRNPSLKKKSESDYKDAARVEEEPERTSIASKQNTATSPTPVATTTAISYLTAVTQSSSSPPCSRRPSRTCRRWQRRSWGEIKSSGASGGGAPPWTTSAQDVAVDSAALPPPPPFPAVPLPAWCRSSSAVAYPLSEDGLTNELVDFFHYTQLTSAETAARARLLRCVEASVDQMWNCPSSASAAAAAATAAGEAKKTAHVSLYGSYALDLSLPSSDIDLVLSFPAEEHEQEKGGDAASLEDAEAGRRRQRLHLERLHDLAEHLRHRSGLSLQVEVYDQCRVPRIYLRDTSGADGVSCDINSSLTSDRVARIVSRQQRWLRDAPLAAFLVRVTKAAVKQWGLNEVFAGGLPSTALYCLVLRFLAQAEQLHQHTRSEKENLSPPRYDEATQSASSLGASMSCSPLSSTSPTTNGTPGTLPSASLGTFAVSAPMSATTVASIQLYVPSWAQRSKNNNTEASQPTARTLAGERASKEKAEGSDSAASVSAACSLGEWQDSARLEKSSDSRMIRSVDLCSGVVEEEAEDGNSDDAEVDALTQEALTCTSCATSTASVTPTTRTAASTPPPPPPTRSSSSSSFSAHSPCDFDVLARAPTSTAAGAETNTVNAAAASTGDFPSAEELTRMAQARYGVSPARLLLKLWRSLSSEAFLSGYQVADVFGDDTVWATSELAGFSGKSSALPGVAAMELATYASRSSTDLSAPSFRLPDLLALFRCSCASLDNMLRFQRYPRWTAPTLLSTIFVDPRTPS